VAKKALGRGLGHLLPSDNAGALRERGAKSSGPAEFGPGLRVLVVPKKPRSEPRVSPWASMGAARVSLVLADVLIVVLVVLWWRTEKASGPLSGAEGLVCVVALLFAGWLSCLAALLPGGGDR
jgi:hypothetical protein